MVDVKVNCYSGDEGLYCFIKRGLIQLNFKILHSKGL